MPIAFATGAGGTNETMTLVLSRLQDILLELDQKLEAGQLIGLTPETIAELQMISATILNFPVDYPDAGSLAQLTTANTSLTAVYARLADILGEIGDTNTLLGEQDPDDIIPHGSGIMGWIESIYSAVASTLQTSDADTHTKLDNIKSSIDSILSYGTGEIDPQKVTLFDDIDPLPLGTATKPLRVDPTNTTPQDVNLVSSSVAVVVDQGSANPGGVDAWPITGEVTQGPSGSPSDPWNISGTVAVSNPGLTDTQLRASAVPVSASALPLPAGAATEATLGTATTSPPTSGAGIVGWLRGIYDKVAGTLTVDGSAHTQPVSATDLPLPTGAALDATLTSGTQLTKITNGAQTADTFLGDSGQNGLAVGGSSKLVPFSLSANSTSAIDVSNFRSCVVQILTNSSTTLSLQGSNDGTNWAIIPSVPLINQASIPSTTAGGGIWAGTGLGLISLGCKFVRMNSTNGAATGNIHLTSFDVNDLNARIVSASQSGTWSITQSGTWTVQPGNTPNTVPWVVSGLPATTSLNAVTATGAGTAKNLTGAMPFTALQVVVGGTGSLSALEVDLEGTLDGANWTKLGQITTTTGGYLAVAASPVIQIRANLVTRTAASGTPAVTATVAAAP